MSNISMLNEYAKFWQMPFEKVTHSSCNGTERVYQVLHGNTSHG